MEINKDQRGKNIIKRIIIYILGLFILALGVAVSINSKLGVSPVNSLPYVISIITGREMSLCVTGVFTFYLIVQIVLLRKEFKIFNLFQLVFSVIFGYFVDLAEWIVGDFAIPTYFGQLIMLAISIVLVAIGVTLYVNVGLINMPMEGMTDAVQRKIFKNKSFYDVKVIMDSLSVAISIVISLVFLGEIVGVREGTVISAILVGNLMKPIQKLILPTVNRICN